MRDAPCAYRPDEEHAHFREQFDQRREEGPSPVHTVIGIEDVLVRLPEALDLPLLLSEGLHDANAGERDQQHVVHLAPSATGRRKAPAQVGADALHEEAHHRHRPERCDGEHGIDRK